MKQIYFVPANTIAPISGVVQAVRERLSSAGSVVSATTDSRLNSDLVENADVVCVMAPRSDHTKLIVGRGVFEAVEMAREAQVPAYLIDPDTLELLRVASFSKTGGTFREWGILILSQNVMKPSALIASIKDALSGRARAPVDGGEDSRGFGYLALALHLGVVSVKCT